MKNIFFTHIEAVFATALLAFIFANRYEYMNNDKLLVNFKSSPLLRSFIWGPLWRISRNRQDRRHPNDQDCSISASDNWKAAQHGFEFILYSTLSSDVYALTHKSVGTFSTVLVLIILLKFILIRRNSQTSVRYHLNMLACQHRSKE